MSDDDRELVNRLFAAATGMLEDAHEIASAAQSSRLSLPQLEDHAVRLKGSAQDIACIAETASIITRLAADDAPNKIP